MGSLMRYNKGYHTHIQSQVNYTDAKHFPYCRSQITLFSFVFPNYNWILVEIRLSENELDLWINLIIPHEIFCSPTVPPMVWIQNQLVGAHLEQQITMECHSEAFPKSINTWRKEGGDDISQGEWKHDFYSFWKNR